MSLKKLCPLIKMHFKIISDLEKAKWSVQEETVEEPFNVLWSMKD
jgi:hypothetical protein